LALGGRAGKSAKAAELPKVGHNRGSQALMDKGHLFQSREEMNPKPAASKFRYDGTVDEFGRSEFVRNFDEVLD
jgi:hypothetical protein